MKTANKKTATQQTVSPDDENTRLLEKLKIFEPVEKQNPEPGEYSLAAASNIVREPTAEEPNTEENDDIHKALIKYYLTNRIPDFVSKDSLSKTLFPALLFAYRNLAKIRYDFPICLPDDPEKSPAIPLKEVFDRLLEKSGLQGDEGELLKHDLYKMESLIKTFVEKHHKIRLSKAWDSAEKQFRNENHSPQADKIRRKKRLADARATLEIDGWLRPFGWSAVLQLFLFAGQKTWQKKVQPLKTEVEQLTITLSALIEADNQISQQIQNSDSLKAAMGKPDSPEMDFTELTALINESHIQETLAPQRRKRIEAVLQSLAFLQNDFFSASTNDPGIPFQVAKNCGDALKMYQANRLNWLEFCKNLRIARLDLANKYVSEKHDALFKNFTEDYLSAEEKAFIPPVYLTLSAKELSTDDKAKLVEILSSDWAIKILLHIDNFVTGDIFSLENLDFWAMNLAKMTLNLNSAFVLQTPAANFPLIIDGFQVGTNFSGPALFSLFVPETHANAPLPADLISAAASDSRVFPTFLFNPEGKNLRARFSLNDSLQAERMWPETEFVYESADGEKRSNTLAFTAADFLAISQNSLMHFLPITREYWRDFLLPLKDFLTLDEKITERIPYLTMVDEAGMIWRVIPSEKVVDFCRKTTLNWQFLQELGGINNSHALHRLELEKDQLAKAVQNEINELKQIHEAEMSRTVDELSREIVARIAAGLLQEGMSMPGAFPVQKTNMPDVAVKQSATTSKPEVAPLPAKETAPEEDEELSFDEPYIDTPLCTSCNECTDKNSLMFAYDENKQAYIKDATAGTFRELVEAAEKCPAHIIHPGKPKNPDEPGLDELIRRAEKFQ